MKYTNTRIQNGYKMGDDEMKFEDLDEAETIYPLSTDSAKKAVELLKNHYVEILTRIPGTKIIIESNLDACANKLLMAIWVSLSAVTESRINELENENKRLRARLKAFEVPEGRK